MDKKIKTNAMRMLDKAKIPYEAVEYECCDGEHIGLHMAAQIDEITVDQCFKTLVAKGERKGMLVFCIPVNKELDMKAAARTAGDKKIEMTHVKDLFDLTGYIRGGCSPIGMKKKFPTFIDASCEKFDKIGISGGLRGLTLILDPKELIKFTRARCGEITKDMIE